MLTVSFLFVVRLNFFLSFIQITFVNIKSDIKKFILEEINYFSHFLLLFDITDLNYLGYILCIMYAFY